MNMNLAHAHEAYTCTRTRQASFCLCPSGDSPGFTQRFYQSSEACSINQSINQSVISMYISSEACHVHVCVHVHVHMHMHTIQLSEARARAHAHEHHPVE